jgi:hypothetical protein
LHDERDLKSRLAKAESLLREVATAAEELLDTNLNCGYAYFSCDKSWSDEQKALRTLLETKIKEYLNENTN